MSFTYMNEKYPLCLNNFREVLFPITLFVM